LGREKAVLEWLFKKKDRPATFVVAQLNARLQPLHRGEHFEDALDAELKRTGYGHVSGGGSLLSKEGEIEHCDVEVQVSDSSQAIVDLIIGTLDGLGAPKGSTLHVEADGRKIGFGRAEGLAVYLNGTDLPDEVYQQCDSNVVYAEFQRLLKGEGRVLSHWQGPRETAFYIYGDSFEAMKARLAAFLGSYPLCERCRVVRVA
jgi:hypothetical protein